MALEKYTKLVTEVDAIQWQMAGQNTKEILTTFFDKVRLYDSGPGDARIILSVASGPDTLRPGWWIIVNPAGSLEIRSPSSFDEQFAVKPK